MKTKPRILLTNDDGIHAPGLKYLWQALAEHADVAIIAPASEQSGAGLGITIRTPLQLHAVSWEKNAPAWALSGTPADCVRIGLSVLLSEPPDFIISGINRGSNAGRNVLYSGTVGAVIEGALRNVPGIAFSCTDMQNPQYTTALPWIIPLVNYLIAHPLPTGTFLNVNFPSTPSLQGVKFARQGRGYWIEAPEERLHPEGHTYYWLGGRWANHEELDDSDVSLLSQGYATAVPIHASELTDLSLFQTRKETFDAHFSVSHEKPLFQTHLT